MLWTLKPIHDNINLLTEKIISLAEGLKLLTKMIKSLAEMIK